MPAERAFAEGDEGAQASRNNSGSQNVAQNKGFIFPDGVLANAYAIDTKRVIASIGIEGDKEGRRHENEVVPRIYMKTIEILI